MLEFEDLQQSAAVSTELTAGILAWQERSRDIGKYSSTEILYSLCTVTKYTWLSWKCRIRNPDSPYSVFLDHRQNLCTPAQPAGEASKDTRMGKFNLLLLISVLQQTNAQVLIERFVTKPRPARQLMLSSSFPRCHWLGCHATISPLRWRVLRDDRFS